MMRHPQMLALVFRQLGAAQRRGLPAHEVAGVLAQDPEWSRAERQAMARLVDALKSHAVLASALEQVPDLVNAEAVQLLRAADAAGRQPEMLDVLADDHDHLAQGAHALKQAMAWPAAVAVVMAALIVMLAHFVLPAFEEAYASLDAPLPPSAQTFFGLAGVISKTVWLWAPLAVAVLLAWKLDRLPPSLVRATGTAWHWIGFVRRHDRSRFVVRLLRWLSACVADSGLAAAALAHLRATEDSPETAHAASLLEASWRQGLRPSEALAQAASLPRRMSLLAQLGERLDDLPAAYAQLADLAQTQEQLAFRRFERDCLLAMYALLGAIVVYSMTSIYLPIFKLGALI